MKPGAFDSLMKSVDVDELLCKLQDTYMRKLIYGKKNFEKVMGLKDEGSSVAAVLPACFL